MGRLLLLLIWRGQLMINCVGSNNLCVFFSFSICLVKTTAFQSTNVRDISWAKWYNCYFSASADKFKWITPLSSHWLCGDNNNNNKKRVNLNTINIIGINKRNGLFVGHCSCVLFRAHPSFTFRILIIFIANNSYAYQINLLYFKWNELWVCDTSQRGCFNNYTVHLNEWLHSFVLN